MARNNSPRSARRLLSLQRETAVLRLRMQGRSYREIAAELGISTTQAHRLVDQALSKMRDESKENTRAMQQLELERLDEMHRALWPLATGKRPSCRAVGLLLRIMEQRFKLLGLEHYRLFAVTGAKGGPVRVEHNRKIEANGLRDQLRELVDSDPRFRNASGTEQGAKNGGGKDE